MDSTLGRAADERVADLKALLHEARNERDNWGLPAHPQPRALPPKPDTGDDMTEQSWPIESIGPKNYDGNRPVKLTNGVLFHADDDELAAAGITPPAPDKRTALYALGLTDEDIAYAAEKWVDGAWLIDGTNKRLTVAIGDAAREVTS